MREIEKWAIGKPFPLSIIYQQCALSVDAVCEFFTELKNNRAFENNFNLTSTDEWLDLYKDHNKILEFFVRFVLDYSALGELKGTKYEDMFFEALALLPDDIKLLTPKTHKKFQKKIFPLLNELYRLNSLEIASDINDDIDNGLREKFRAEILTMPEAAFFFLIWAPCNIFYLQNPTKLFFLARNGNVDALEKLLLLDSSVVAEKRIANQLHRLRIHGRRSDYERVMQALTKQPDIPTTRKTLKYRIAGFISSVSIVTKPRLSAPDIRNLYDAIAKDRGVGLVDPDIEGTPESFTRRVYDHREFWKPLFQPDKK